MNNHNILISSAGRRVSLVRDFKKSLIKIIPDAKVLTTDAVPELSAACQVADGHFKVPRLNDPSYIEVLLKHCITFEIGLIIPTIDTELLLLAEHKERFAEEGIQVLVSDNDLIKACRNKRLTHQLFAAHTIAHAQEVNLETTQYPVFSKPEGGSSSIGIHLFHSATEITDALRTEKGRMFLEYLSPDQHTEFTIDLYYDKSSTLKCCVPRQRIETRSGEVSKGITRYNHLIPLLYNKLGNLKGARGCITLQVFVNITDPAIVTGIEINPRFGGGYPLSYAAGADYPSMIICEYFLNEAIADFRSWEENLLLLRYDEEVWVHAAKVD